MTMRTAKKQQVQIGKTSTLHLQHAFLYISLPSLHNYDVKRPNFMFVKGMRTHDNHFLFHLLLVKLYSPLAFNSWKIADEKSWNKNDEVWSSTNSLFKGGLFLEDTYLSYLQISLPIKIWGLYVTHPHWFTIKWGRYYQINITVFSTYLHVTVSYIISVYNCIWCYKLGAAGVKKLH